MMNTAFLLKNTIQEYAWGSHTAISGLLGKIPSDAPQAEMWMGAHPKASSIVRYGKDLIDLFELIKKNPEIILGRNVADKFNGRLPFLFKVLAAAKPLSIQAHPGIEQAKQGFERENRQNIPLDAFNRNYKDDNHKPECICAITTFFALNGFRSIPQIIELMKKACSETLKNEISILSQNSNPKGLKTFFNFLMTIDKTKRKKIIHEAFTNAKKMPDDRIFQWMINLHGEYSDDVGILFPAILNLVCLKPGQAMFLPAMELHSYLDGVGMELMANSDNVLRGGLTPKHVDVPELVKSLNFESKQPEILQPVSINSCESVYSSAADEFLLSVIDVNNNNSFISQKNRNVEILLCTRGSAFLSDENNNETFAVDSGVSMIIPASTGRYIIKGDAVFYKATVP